MNWSIINNAPVTIGYIAIMCSVLIVQACTRHKIDNYICAGTANFTQPNKFRFIISIIASTFAHSGIPHLTNNCIMLLLVLPAIEYRLGTSKTLELLATLIILNGLISDIYAKVTHRYGIGASGVVYSVILLSSIVNISPGQIPITMILVGGFYLGSELFKEIKSYFDANKDGINHGAHIIGGVIGGIIGLLMFNPELTQQIQNYYN